MPHARQLWNNIYFITVLPYYINNFGPSASEDRHPRNPSMGEFWLNDHPQRL